MTTSTEPGTGREEVIWRIGDPALGPEQFAPEVVRADASPWEFVVGKSDPARDWPARLSGPMDAHGGWRAHTATIRFVTDDPAGSHLLRLGVQVERGPCPELSVEVNGIRGLAFPDLVLTDRSRLNPVALNGGEGVLEIPLPDGVLVAGHNEITLTATAIDTSFEQERRRHREQFGHGFGSQLGWTFVELVTAPRRAAAAHGVQVRPLPLFRHGDGGRLNQLVDVYLDIEPDDPPSAISVDGRAYPVDVGDWSFGATRIRAAIPEFTEPRTLGVEVESGSGRRRSEHRVTPSRKWTLHLIPHVHLDLGYTDYQGKVVELHSRNLDRALEILAEVPDYRLMVDGAMILDGHLRTRDPDASDRVLAAVRSGAFSLNAYYALFLTGLASLEECLRATYLSARLAEEHDLPVTYANLTDVPSYSHAMPSLLRAAGIDAFLGIQNHTRGGNADSDSVNHNAPYVWEGPDGATVLAYFSDSYNQLRYLAADPPMTAGLAVSLPRYLSLFERPDYLPADLPIVGIHTDNEDLDDGEADFVAAWNEQYAYPRLRWSTPADYFASVKPLMDRLPRWKGDGGSYWEDGAGTAAAIVARYRAAQSLLPVAESLQAVVALGNDLAPDRAALDDAWAHVLIGCEHTWTSSHASRHPHSQQSTDQLAWKRHHVESAARIATDETRRGLSQLADRISLPGASVVVYNAASWARGGEITVELARELTVTDEAGVELPAEREAVDGLDRLRLTVGEIPAFGYRVLPIRPRTTTDQPDPGRFTGRRLRTDRWELTVDPASARVTGLTHLASGRRLVDSERNPMAWGLGELLYVTGGGTEEDRGVDPHTRTSLYNPKQPLRQPDLTIESADLGPAQVVRTPRGWLLRASGSASSMPVVRSELRLYDDDDRVDLEIFVRKLDVLAKESVYVAFPFALSEPVVRFDRHLGWIDPATDHTPGACNEWFTASNVVAVTGTEGTVMWSSPDTPLFTVGDVVRGTWATRFQPDGTLLSWAMNNYWFTNTPASQSGDITLRYSFTFQTDWDPVAAARFGREVRTPLAAGEVIPNDKFHTERGPLVSAPTSLLPLQLPEHVAGTIHQAREGRAAILRLQELSGRSATVELPSGFAGIYQCTSDERHPRPLTARHVTVPAHGIVTLRLETS
jgi:alpha-mannosidase